MCNLPSLGYQRELAKIHSSKWSLAKTFISTSPHSDFKPERAWAFCFVVKNSPMPQSACCVRPELVTPNNEGL